MITDTEILDGLERFLSRPMQRIDQHLYWSDSKKTWLWRGAGGGQWQSVGTLREALAGLAESLPKPSSVLTPGEASGTVGGVATNEQPKDTK